MFLGTLVLLFAVQAQAPALVTPADQTAALQFTQALTSSRIRTFTPLAADPDELGGDPWLSVRNFFGRYDCISIPSYKVSRDGEWLVVDADGSGTLRNARHNVRAIPQRWYLRLNAAGAVVQAMSEADFIADMLIRAADDDARRAIVLKYDAMLPEIAHRIAELSIRTDRVRLRPAALFLAEWTQHIDDPATETYAWCALARLARYGRDTPTAIRMADVARAVARRSDSCELHAYAGFVAGTVCELSDGPRIHEALDPVVAEIDALDDPAPAGWAINALAGLQFGTADFTGTYQRLAELLELSKRYGWRDGELLGYQGQSAVKAALSDGPGTIEIASRTANVAHELMNREFEARSCNMIGEAYATDVTPNFKLAVPWLERALKTAPKTVAIAAIYHVNLGLALVELGRLREAEPHLQPALDNGREAKFIVNAFELGAHLRRAQGRYREAMDFTRQGIKEGPTSLFMVWQLKGELGQMLIECGEQEDGIEELRESIDLVEARRVLSTSSGMIRARYFETRQWVYATLLDVLLGEKRYGEALAIAERMKARSLDDSLADAKTPLPLSAAELEQERALNQRVVDLNKTIITSPGKAEAEARKQLRVARAELELFSEDMAIRHSHSFAMHAGTDPSDLVAAWHGAPVIEYAVLPDSIAAFVVRNGRVVARKLPLPRETIESTTNRLVQSIEQRDLEYQHDARKLYDALLAPVADLLPPSGAVTIVPDGFLWRVPFDALRTPARKFVAEKYSLAYAPSLLMLDRARHHHPEAAAKELLAFGDPVIGGTTSGMASAYRDLSLGALPDAVREVRALSNLYGHAQSTVRIGKEATESSLKKLIGNYRVVHLATHGIVDDASPLYSALVLATTPGDADDGLLEMREIGELDLHADLVVLSGCDTARGKVYPGEGVIGMSWALLTSGCPTTVVSQWVAPSRSTSKLMIEFHRRLLAGETKGDALRHARLALMREPNYRHPFYWAPFVVIGDGTSALRTH